MPFPGAKIEVSNGNLQQEIAVLDGVPCLAATAEQAANIHAVKQVYSLQDAETKGITEADEPFMYSLVKEYYTELAGKQLLYLYGTAETETMADVLAVTGANGVLAALNAGNGNINLVAVARKASAGYDAGEEFLDTDVKAAVTAAKAIGQARQTQNSPVRIFIEGRVANETVVNTYLPKEQANGFAAVVLGGTAADGSAAVSLALARAVKYPAHVKLGSGQNGALSALQIYIGSQIIESRHDMETLHDAGFLTFHHRAGTAGYYFGRDNMCSADDFRILAHGRVIDKAQRIAGRVFLPFTEDFVRLNSDGTVNDTDASYIENVLETALRSNEGAQFSDCKVAVDRTASLTATSNLPVSIQILPLGYMTWITITIGLTAEIQAS